MHEHDTDNHRMRSHNVTAKAMLCSFHKQPTDQKLYLIGRYSPYPSVISLHPLSFFPRLRNTSSPCRHQSGTRKKLNQEWISSTLKNTCKCKKMCCMLHRNRASNRVWLLDRLTTVSVVVRYQCARCLFDDRVSDGCVVVESLLWTPTRAHRRHSHHCIHVRLFLKWNISDQHQHHTPEYGSMRGREAS